MRRALLHRLDTAFFDRQLSIYPRTLAALLDANWSSLLDVGCGADSPLRALSQRIPFTVGVDAHEASIEESRNAGVHNEHKCLDILRIADHFGSSSFDVVAALDVVEHLERDQGLALLEAAEAVARRLVIIFTPNGYLRQDAVGGNPWQVHRSGWQVDDFRQRGYQVLGMYGWKPLRGELWHPTVPPPGLGRRLSGLTQPVVTMFPKLAFQLLAVRQQGEG